MKNFIVASASPRRRELLTNAGFSFDIIPSDADETLPEGIGTEEAVCLLAERKALSVLESREDSVVLGCDTVVVLDDVILGKPSDREDAKRMIRMLSGKAHTVTSGVALLYQGEIYTDSATTKVFFDELDEAFISEYIASDEPYDKAGAYAIQGKAAPVISRIEGCYFNVVGLPVNCLARLAKKNGIELEFRR